MQLATLRKKAFNSDLFVRLLIDNAGDTDRVIKNYDWFAMRYKKLFVGF